MPQTQTYTFFDKYIRAMLIHAADLNNPCLDFENYMNWAKLITQEFHDQTLAEKDAGLPVTGFLQYKNELGFYNGQKFFAGTLVCHTGVLVMPLFEIIKDFFPEVNLVRAIKKNLKKVEEKIAELSKT